MWPWSTLKALRKALKYSDDQIVVYMDRIDELEVQSAEKDSGYGSQIINLEEQLDRSRKATAYWIEVAGRANTEKTELREQLAEAQRNDARDPKSGRFVKVVK